LRRTLELCLLFDAVNAVLDDLDERHARVLILPLYYAFIRPFRIQETPRKLRRPVTLVTQRLGWDCIPDARSWRICPTNCARPLTAGRDRPYPEGNIRCQLSFAPALCDRTDTFRSGVIFHKCE